MPGRVWTLLRRAWSRRRRAARVAAVAGALLVVGLVARDWAVTRSATDRTAADLVEARADLDRAGDDRDEAHDELDDTRATLATDLASLEARLAERTEAQGNLDATTLWLTTLEQQLVAATSELEASSGRLATLQQCLVGVAEALNQAAARDTAGLAGTVREIEATCAAAGAVL